MSSWKDDKDLGPWDFTEQQDKWGYVNNKRWSSQQDAQEFCEDIGLSLDPTHTHKPCGHWHKHIPTTQSYVNLGVYEWWQPSVDVLDGKVGVISMNKDAGLEIPGIVSLIYDVSAQSWVSWGLANGINVEYAEPNTCRLADDYMAFYGYFYLYATDHYAQGIYIFKDGEDPAYTDVFVDDVSGTPYYLYNAQYYNSMDCSGDRIACIAHVYKDAGATVNKFYIKVSNDQGATFPTTWTFPTRLSYGDQCKIRISEDGIVWAVYMKTNYSSIYQIELWKSNAGATSWTKIWNRDYYADVGNRTATHVNLDVSDTDGQYITIFIEAGDAGGTYYNCFYSSVDYGASFTTRTMNTATYDLRVARDIYLSAKDQYNVVLVRKIADGDKKFIRSTDYSANFSEVDDTVGIGSNYPDLQGHDNEMVFGECGVSYIGGDYQDIAYSDDYGATWTRLPTPAPINTPSEDQLVAGGSAATADEPQIWTMDF